ncbi:MAG TPA: YlxR family protein [Pseudonocardia sp.]
MVVIRESAPGSTSLPVRTCVGCRLRSSATGLLRVVAVDGVLTPDPRRRLPGRGAWLHPDPECLDRALRRRAFPRALRVPGTVTDDALRRHLQPETKCETVSHLDHESQDDPS